MYVMETQPSHQGTDSLFTIQKEQINCFTVCYYQPVYWSISCEWLTELSAEKHGLLHHLVSWLENRDLVSPG